MEVLQALELLFLCHAVDGNIQDGDRERDKDKGREVSGIRLR